MGYCKSYFNPDYNDTTACGYTVVMEAKAFSYSTTYRSSSSFWYANNGTVPYVREGGCTGSFSVLSLEKLA